ncbi:hypothetical protein ACFW04_014584 [Cataglyphis niger]
MQKLNSKSRLIFYLLCALLQFFNISAKEAHVIDPECRMLLEHIYEAIIDAGINPVELQGTNTSVITAISNCDTFLDLIYEKSHVCSLHCVIANKISYSLGVAGTSYNIDIACISSHYAMIEAYRMILSGICEAAIVARILPNDGYCKLYDEEGSGYMRSDAVVITYLQKTKDAGRIYATFVYGKTNCDGFKEEGIIFTSFDKEKMLLEEFYEDCSVKSVKSNNGHPEPVSDHCQIGKVNL